MLATTQRCTPLPARSPLSACRKSRRTGVRVSAGLEVPDFTGRQLSLLTTSEEATAHLASLLARETRPADAYCLKGDAGAGKSAFSRAFVRAANNDPGMHVPVGEQRNVYGNAAGPPIHHYDLARLSRDDAAALDLAASLADAVCLVEAAERLQEWGAAPDQRLAMWFRRLPADAMAAALDGRPVQRGYGGEEEQRFRLLTIIPHTSSWELRVGLLFEELARTGMAAGLVVLSDDLAAPLTAGLPEYAPPQQLAPA